MKIVGPVPELSKKKPKTCVCVCFYCLKGKHAKCVVHDCSLRVRQTVSK